MKTYLLRSPRTVEPQKPARPAPVATAGPAAVSAGPVLFVGLDVHQDSIAVSLVWR